MFITSICRSDDRSLETGGGDPLKTESITLAVPTSNALPRLSFDLVFATDELPQPGSFVDSFSITLETPDRSRTALLLTLDAFGLQLAPANPGGMTVAVQDIHLVETNFPGISTLLSRRFDYLIAYTLPFSLTGGPLNVFLDLFDNLNAAGSIVHVRNLRMETAAAPIKLFSAPVISGASTEETGAVVNATLRTFTLPRPETNRFYRIQADRETRIVGIHVQGPQLVISYEFLPPVQLTLLTSDSVTGLFSAAVGALWNEANGTFTLARPSANSFFRVVGNRLTTITGIRIANGDLVIGYELNQ